MIEINPDWMSIASALDAERANGTSRGPLHGIPVITKNNIATGDSLNITDGGLALLGSKAEEAFVVKNLRKAGVIILGTANESEDADHRSGMFFVLS